jgi:AcrB/AcrD/AcrF family
VLERVRKIPGLTDVTTDREQGGSQLNVTIDRNASARLGVATQDINNALNNAFAQRQVSLIYGTRNQYRVILEVDPRYQRDPSDLSRVYVPGAKGIEVPILNVIKIERGLAPLVVNHQGPFPAVTISYNLAEGTTLDDARKGINQAIGELGLPESIRAEAAGDAKAFAAGAGAQPLLLLAALLAVYIVLGVLYESLAHPLTIISTLPSAGLGALVALQLYGMELSLIAFIGIILLIGIVKKNGIMMVDFALPPHPDDDARLAARRHPAGHCDRPRRGTAPPAWYHHHRRPRRQPDPDALHHARSLSFARPPSSPPDAPEPTPGNAGAGTSRVAFGITHLAPRVREARPRLKPGGLTAATAKSHSGPASQSP